MGWKLTLVFAGILVLVGFLIFQGVALPLVSSPSALPLRKPLIRVDDSPEHSSKMLPSSGRYQLCVNGFLFQHDVSVSGTVEYTQVFKNGSAARCVGSFHAWPSR